MAHSAVTADSLLAPLNPPQREAVTTTKGPRARPGRGGQRQDPGHRPPHRLSPRRSRASTRGTCSPSPSPTRPPARCATGWRTCCCRRGSARRSSPPSTRRACASCGSARPSAGLPPSFVIYDEDDRLSLVKEAHARARLRRAHADARHGRAPHQPLQEPDAVAPRTWSNSRAPRARSASPRSTGSTRRSCGPRARVDFDDLLLRVVRLLETVPEALAWYRTRLDATSWSTSTRTPTARSTASSSSSPRSTGTSAWWAIPTSRSTAGAAPTSATSSTSRRTIPDCRVVALEQNYRSTKRILDIASAVIANNTARKDKRSGPRTREGERAAGLPGLGRERGGGLRGPDDPGAARREGVDYRDVAVFYRTNAQSRVLEDALRRAGIPYLIVGGVRFYERREIKDMVAYLRLIVEPARRRGLPPRRRGARPAASARPRSTAWPTRPRAAGVPLLAACADAARRHHAASRAAPSRSSPASSPAWPSGARGLHGARAHRRGVRGLRLPRRAEGGAHRRRPRRGSRTWRSWSPPPRSSSRRQRAAGVESATARGLPRLDRPGGRHRRARRRRRAA